MKKCMATGIAPKCCTDLFPLWFLRKNNISEITVTDFSLQSWKDWKTCSLPIVPSGITAINIKGATIHTAVSIPINHFLVMSVKQRTWLRNKLQYVQFIIIYEISMVPTKVLWNIHKQISEIFETVDKTSFVGKIF